MSDKNFDKAARRDLIQQSAEQMEFDFAELKKHDPYKGIMSEVFKSDVVKNEDLKKRELTGYGDIDAFLEDCLDTMHRKGHDYRQGNDDDLLHNFRTVAESVGTEMMTVWSVYFYKHFAAMMTYIKEGGQSESEPIESRIKDQVVYLLLFFRMVQEHKKKQENMKHMEYGTII